MEKEINIEETPKIIDATPVKIVTVKNHIPLFKGEDKANKIHLLEFEEIGYQVVSQIGLYEVGDKAIFITPDYSLSDMPIFEDYIAPDGDPKKSKLGSKNRVKAVKFNLHVGNGMPVYSYGIILPYKMVSEFLKVEDLSTVDLTATLKIEKWEEPEPCDKMSMNQGGSCSFPSFLYRTDETNINNLVGHLQFPITLIGTEKVDGSSITIYYNNGESGVCSRNLKKPVTYRKLIKKRKDNWLTKILKKWFKIKVDRNIYQIVENESEFNRIGNPYLDDLVQYCKKHNVNIAVRGELNGKGLKGSGNKNNPAVKNDPNIKWYGADFIVDGRARKMTESEFHLFLDEINSESQECIFNRCTVLFNKIFESFEELIKSCNEIFSDDLIEGIVVKTHDTSFSAKVMNLSYDALKQ